MSGLYFFRIKLIGENRAEERRAGEKVNVDKNEWRVEERGEGQIMQIINMPVCMIIHIIHKNAS